MGNSAFSPTNFTQTRLERAYNRINENWFPVNAEHLNRIRSGLTAGNYDLDIEFLLGEIKTDFALFTHCLRCAAIYRAQQKTPQPSDSNPFNLLRGMGLAKLREFLEADEIRISKHSIDSATPQQSDRLRAAMVSASTAEVLAGANSLAPETGFSTALLRQLGLALIAWNYPTVYERACQHSDESNSLEALLGEILGFSPALFASYVVSRWGMPEETRAIVAGTGQNVGPLSEEALTLKKICEVGEALARADNPALYPTASADWESARAAIESMVGADGLRHVQTQIEKNCEAYRASYPNTFASTENFNPANKLTDFRERNLFRTNSVARSCSPSIKKVLKDLYAQMDQFAISQHSIRELTQNIIPLAGFSGGCVYVLDPSTQQFVPRLKMGQLQLRQANVVSATPFRVHADPVVIAFECNTPMIEHADSGSPTDMACIAAGLGTKKRVGVLYLEIIQSMLDNPEDNVLNHFKAIRKALEDALHLE